MNNLAHTGLVFCPCKPYKNGDDYHIIWCSKSGFVYGWEIVEGRDHPIPMGRPQFETSPNTKKVGLVL